jgi:hypothetical protein
VLSVITLNVVRLIVAAPILPPKVTDKNRFQNLSTCPLTEILKLADDDDEVVRNDSADDVVKPFFPPSTTIRSE